MEQVGTNLKKQQNKLSEWLATGICGNDITSSCLYVSAYALLWAGAWGPVCLLIVAFVLWLFRGIYAEVVGALPLNGGAYNALLNTTSKFRASIAACLTILSYLATAVISANVAVSYALDEFSLLTGYGFSSAQEYWTTVAILFVFASLTYRGIGESAKVALGIFIFHMASLVLVVIIAGVWLSQNGFDTFHANRFISPPEPSNWPILFGFCVSLLGISGFESSANFVEEQEEGVFPKTLRNMWAIVSVANPLIAFLVLCVIPLPDVAEHQKALLIHLVHEGGGSSIGPWLGLIISIDAAFVLCGAVLTSFIGVTGLVHRMTLDRCLPQTLLKKGRYNTFTYIIFLFFFLASLLLYVAGDVKGLAVVYTISFLSVMLLFTLGNALLKLKRARLPRETRVSWLTIIIAGSAVTIGLIGNVILKLEYAIVFAYYFVPTLIIVTIMLSRTTLLKLGIYILRGISNKISLLSHQLSEGIRFKLEEINSQSVVFFTRGDNIANLNEALLYVRNNEHTNNIKIVTVVKDEKEVPEHLAADLDFLNKAYPEINIEFVVHKDTFSPKMLTELSEKWNIPLNFMFIGSPGDKFPHAISELGGVRLII